MMDSVIAMSKRDAMKLSDAMMASEVDHKVARSSEKD